VNLSDSIHSWFGCQLVNLRQLHNLAQCCASPEKISVRILMPESLWTESFSINECPVGAFTFVTIVLSVNGASIGLSTNHRLLVRLMCFANESVLSGCKNETGGCSAAAVRS